jgi:hypothetical protein
MDDNEHAREQWLADLNYKALPLPSGGLGKPGHINYVQIKRCAVISNNLDELASFLSLTRGQLEQAIEANPTIGTVIENAWHEGNLALRKKQFDLAMNGSEQMLKWLGKNRLQQSDKVEIKQDVIDKDRAKELLQQAWNEMKIIDNSTVVHTGSANRVSDELLIENNS